MHPHDQYVTGDYAPARPPNGQDARARRRRKKFETAVEAVHQGSWVAILSFWGVLARLGLIALNNYPGAIIPPVTWAQFVGCAVMGFLVQDSSLFPKKPGTAKYDALYAGLTTGFCGSLTTFSSWMLNVYESLVNVDGYDRDRGYSVISVFAQLCVQFAAAIIGFRLGNHLARGFAQLPASWCIRRPIPRPCMGSTSEMAATVLAILIALVSVAGSVLVAALRPEWRGVAGFALVFAPVGALTRWLLAKWLNDRLSYVPIGTFVANVAGTFLEGILYLLQYYVADGGRTSGGRSNGCALLQGLQDGLCGALTTVSSLVLELCTLQLGHAYKYGLLSVALSLSLLVLVDGIDFWTHGSAHGGRSRCRP